MLEVRMTSLNRIKMKRLIVTIITMIIGVGGMLLIVGCDRQDEHYEHNSEKLVHETMNHEMVWFNDRVLESTVVAALSGISVCAPGEVVAGDIEIGKGIMIEDLAELTSLCVGNKGVTDLSGLEYCTNLTILNLDRNRISDISALSNLTNLTVLGLAGNQVNDISSLATLKDLEYLYLGENQIEDVSSLRSLNKLSVLSIYSNQISDISPLNSLGELTLLDIRDNEINDISALESLNKLSMVNVSMDHLSRNSEAMQFVRSLEDRGVIFCQEPLPGTN